MIPTEHRQQRRPAAHTALRWRSDDEPRHRTRRPEAAGTLAGGIAHDFDNILGAILGYGEMALEDAPSGSRLRRAVENMLAAAERGRTLVEQVLLLGSGDARELVAGGAVNVSSTPGAGSVFAVYLPQTDNAEKDEPVGEADIPQGQGERILVVDDEAALASLLERILSELGYRCDGFTSGAAALQAFCAAPGEYAAVITDERMPGMWGTALIHEMRRIRADLPALLVSGHVGAGLLARAHEVGVPQVLAKPLARRDVAVALARLLGRR